MAWGFGAAVVVLTKRGKWHDPSSVACEGASDAPGATGGGSHSVYRRLSAVVVSGVEERRQKKEKAKNPKRELK